jgi:hypothetical protein
MEPDIHRQARFLLEEARIAGIREEEALWVRSHVAECAECGTYEEELEGVIRGLRSFVFEAGPEPRFARRAGREARPTRWVAAAVLLIVAAVPAYEGLRHARRANDDARLIETVESRLGRIAPLALEPLERPQ